MAILKSVDLSITAEQPRHHAIARVECSLEFTDFEVNAMNILGLQYDVRCRILNQHVMRNTSVVVFEPKTYPSRAGEAKGLEYLLFGKETPMQDLHEHVFTRDKLIAEVTLKNMATGVEQVARSREITLDLAA